MLPGISARLLTEAFEDGAAGYTPLAFKNAGIEQTTHSIEWGEGVQSGVVQIEAADRSDYTGTWTPIATMTFDGSITPAPKVDEIVVSGVHKTFRHRVDGALPDGTVTTVIRGQL
jgi:hypothetical protein